MELLEFILDKKGELNMTHILFVLLVTIMTSCSGHYIPEDTSLYVDKFIL